MSTDQTEKTYELYPSYYRVSTVADALDRTTGDGLMHVGATWSSQRAIEIARELLSGKISPEVARWELANEDVDVINYLGSDWYAGAIKAGAVRNQQAAKDRGTILNIVWDFMNQCRINGENFSTNDAVDFGLQEIEAKRFLAKLAQDEYEIAMEAGLIDDKAPRPERGYQCSNDDVLPFIIVLAQWYPNAPWKPIRRQGFVVNHEDQTMGTWDDFGLWDGDEELTDLKSASDKQPKLYNVVQIAKYLKEFAIAEKKMCNASNIIVTPEGVYRRRLSTKGYAVGNAQFDRALAILKDKSMAGLFESASQSRKK